MNLLFKLLFLFLFPVVAFGQSFVNGDLEGPTNAPGSTLAPGWQTVPVGDPNSMATNPGIGDTPDLTSATGPLMGNGIFGNPYSGNTFMSGFISSDASGNRHHEGIWQTVTGLVPDSTYEIGFMQAVVKQNNCLDASGAWAFYVDSTLIGVTNAAVASDPHQNLNLNWGLQTFLFTATATSHVLKFMPDDDDDNFNIGSDVFGAVRMGIDSIHFRFQTCPLAVNLGPDTTVCANAGLLLSAANPGAAYTWSTGSTAPAVVATQTGTYWVKVNNGICSRTDTVTITALQPPSVSLGNDTALCAGSPLQLQALATPGASLLWHTGDTTSVISATTTGNYQVAATLNGCTSSDAVLVQFHPYPVFSLGPDTTLCEGKTLVLNAALPNATYSWHNGSAGPAFTAANPGNFWVSVTQNGCATVDSVSVAFTPLPEISLGPDLSVCEGTPVTLVANTAGATLLWSDNSTGSELQPAQTGAYWVTATHQGCSRTDSVIVEFREMPQVSLGSYEPFCLGETVSLNGTVPGAAYLWQDSSTAGTFLAQQPGLYWVEVTVNNCTARSEVTLQFTDCETALVMPNIFTPNNDGVNDTFAPIQVKNITAGNLRVYNRWGAEVYFSDKVELSWDGRATDSGLVPEGTYLWEVTIEHLLGGSSGYKGWVTVVK